MSSYEQSGVNLDAADELIERIGWRVTSTWTEDVVGGFGGFAAGLQIPAGFEVPVLMMSTDGVGTKADLARQAGLIEGLGYDLVAMVADDLAAAGAQPIALTDYIAVGRLDVDVVETLIESITDACSESDIALLGGETAEHPGVMAPDQFDMQATALGIVEMGEEVNADHVGAGDIIIGVKSPNLRSNGFSLVRAIVAKHLDLDADFPDTSTPTGEVLLDPSIVYAPAVVNLLARTTAPWPRPHHRRGATRQRHSCSPRGDQSRHRAIEVGGSSRLQGPPEGRRGPTGRHVPYLQHGYRIHRGCR